MLSYFTRIQEPDLQKVKQEVPTFDQDLKHKRIFMLDYSVLHEFMHKFNNGVSLSSV